MDKKISLIIPCYNVERYLDRCINSLVNQTMGADALQLILVDDASTDRTGRKLNFWKERYPNTIEVITLPENRRQGGARNEGLKHAAAPFTGFVDSDDWVEPDMYEILYVAMQEERYDFVNCFLKRVFGKNEGMNRSLQEDKAIQIVTNEDRKKFLMEKLPGGIVCKLFRTDYLRRHAVAFPENTAYEDNYWMALLKLQTCSCKIIGQELYHYFVNPNSTTLSQDSDRHLDRLSIEEKKIAAYKELHIFDAYYREFEFQFLRMYYINSLHTFFMRMSDMGKIPFQAMQRKTKEYFPDYRSNPYLSQLNGLQMELLKTLEMELTVGQWTILAENYKKMMGGTN